MRQFHRNSIKIKVYTLRSLYTKRSHSHTSYLFNTITPSTGGGGTIEAYGDNPNFYPALNKSGNSIKMCITSLFHVCIFFSVRKNSPYISQVQIP